MLLQPPSKLGDLKGQGFKVVTIFRLSDSHLSSTKILYVGYMDELFHLIQVVGKGVT